MLAVVGLLLMLAAFVVDVSINPAPVHAAEQAAADQPAD
jgi:hypothetical protein